MQAGDPHAHAEAWIRAWNAHDLEAILEHYSEDVTFRASTAAQRWGKPDGVLRGKDELRAHFAKGLELVPTLAFTLEDVFVCPGGYAVLYRRENGNRVIDAVLLDEAGRAREVVAYYAKRQA